MPGINPLVQHDPGNFNLACWNTDLPRSVLALNRLFDSQAANQVAESARSVNDTPDQTVTDQPISPEPVCSPIDAPSSPSGSLYRKPLTQHDPDRFNRFTDQLARMQQR